MINMPLFEIIEYTYNNVTTRKISVKKLDTLTCNGIPWDTSPFIKNKI